MSKEVVKSGKKSTSLNSPIWWVGGKSKLSREIISLFPKGYEDLHYIEVFWGGLSVLFKKNPSKLETINDLNNDLINLWEIVKSKPQTLSYYLNQLFVSRVIFDKIKLQKYIPKNDIERASYFYYLTSQSFGSKGDNFAMSTKAFRKPKNLWKDFLKWSRRLQFVTIENMGFEKLILKYDSTNALLYLDPPYFDTESYYKVWFNKKQHVLLRDLLLKVKGKFLLSYNDCVEIRELYKDKRFKIQSSKDIEYTLWKNVHGKRKVVSELYITNY